MTRALAVVAALLVCLVQWPARADDRLERAKGVADRARSLAASGEYHGAARAYAEAFRLVPNAVVKYNEAESWYAAGQRAPAADAYEHALKMETLDAARTTRSKQLLAELERDLGVLVIEEPRGGLATVAHARAQTLPARIHLEPGGYTVVVESKRERHERSVTIAPGRAQPLVLPRPRVSPEPPPVPVERPEPEGGHAQRILGFTALGLGGAAGIASAVVGGMFLAELDAFEDGGRTDAALRDRTLTLQAWTSGTAIAGAVLTAVGVLLVLTAPSADEAGARWLGPRGIAF